MTLDFTLSKFHSLCSTVAQHYLTLTLAEYFQGKDLPTRFVMICHDIDRKPENALFTARIEAESGIRATYYFRRYGSAFRPEIMKEIEGRGAPCGSMSCWFIYTPHHLYSLWYIKVTIRGTLPKIKFKRVSPGLIGFMDWLIEDSLKNLEIINDNGILG
jgi:hypothetical protein